MPRPFGRVPRHHRVDRWEPVGPAAPAWHPPGPDGVDGAPDARRVAQPDLVAQRVGQRLARVTAHDPVPAQVERGVQVDERHRAAVLQRGQHRVPEGPSPHPRGVGSDGWERRSIVRGRAAAVAVRHARVQALAEGVELAQQLDPVGGEGPGVLVETIEVTQQRIALDLQLHASAPGHPAGEAHHRHVEVMVAAAPRADGHGRSPHGGIEGEGERHSRDARHGGTGPRQRRRATPGHSGPPTPHFLVSVGWHRIDIESDSAP